MWFSCHQMVIDHLLSLKHCLIKRRYITINRVLNMKMPRSLITIKPKLTSSWFPDLIFVSRCNAWSEHGSELTNPYHITDSRWLSAQVLWIPVFRLLRICNAWNFNNHSIYKTQAVIFRRAFFRIIFLLLLY